MLTRVELKTMHLIYGFSCSNLNILSLFKWDNVQIKLKPNLRPVSNFFLSLTVLFDCIFHANQLSDLIEAKAVNAGFLQLIFIIRLFGQFILRINMWIYRSELARLINQTAAIDKAWGKQI